MDVSNSEGTVLTDCRTRTLVPCRHVALAPTRAKALFYVIINGPSGRRKKKEKPSSAVNHVVKEIAILFAYR